MNWTILFGIIVLALPILVILFLVMEGEPEIGFAVWVIGSISAVIAFAGYQLILYGQAQ